MAHQNLDIFTHYLIDRFAPIALFLNEDLDVIYIHGSIERFFSFPKALVKFNVTRMLKGETVRLFQDGVEQCLADDGPLIYREVVFEKQNETAVADLRFQKLVSPELNQPLVFVAIIPRDEDGSPTLESDKVKSIDHSTLWEEKAKTLEFQLKDSRLKTQNLIDEQEAMNEELQASNRELMASNEELQSTNEELQSVNEELHTVNVELQYKNEALSLAKNDILNLLKSTEIGTIFLDKDLNIRRFTPAVRKYFNLLDMDIGRPISNFSSNFINVNISKICQEVYHSLDKFEKEIKDSNGNHILLRILPYRTENDLIQGLVVTFVDVNELIKVRERMFTFAEKFKAIFQNAKDLILDLSKEGEIKKASRSFGGISANALKGKKIFDLLPEKEARKLQKAFQEMPRTFNILSFNFRIKESVNEFLHYRGILIPLSESDAGRSLASIIAIVQDISQEVKTQSELKQSVEEYQAFMDNARHQIALVDSGGFIKYVNYTQHTGVNKAKMIGTRIYDYLPSSEQTNVEQSLNNIFNGNPFETIRFLFKNNDGEDSSVELVATPIIIGEEIKYVALIGYNERSL